MADDAAAPTTKGSGMEPRSAAVSFITTEHFTLQGARAMTVAESTARATMFLGAVSAGLVALGLLATATQVGTAFYAFGLILFATLAFVGLVTFERALQSGIEDLGYAHRIAQLRAFYFDNAPELGPYLYSVPPTRRIAIQGLRGGVFQSFRTVAGMVAMITSVLAGSTAGLLAAVSSDESLGIGLATGGAVGATALVAMMRYQHKVWQTAEAEFFSGAVTT